MTISVLMSTYNRENPQYLDTALKSIWTDQIRKPDQVILVEDGVLTPELDVVVDKWKNIIGEKFTLVANSVNKGLADALNDGIKHATSDFIARMDSDDISLPERFKVEEQYMISHPEVDILGGALSEFNDEGTLNTIRFYPLSMRDIMNSMHRMAPMGHPTVMFRKRFFDDGFRYSNKYYICEDVTLWFDAACAGRVMNNIPEVVLKFRRNDTMMTRRSRKKAWSELCAYNDGIYRLCGIFTIRYVYSFLRFIFRLMPLVVIKSLYQNVVFRNSLS